MMRPAEEKSLRDHTPKTTKSYVFIPFWRDFFLRDFCFHYVIYPHLYVICNPELITLTNDRYKFVLVVCGLSTRDRYIYLLFVFPLSSLHTLRTHFQKTKNIKQEQKSRHSIKVLKHKPASYGHNVASSAETNTTKPKQEKISFHLLSVMSHGQSHLCSWIFASLCR